MKETHEKTYRICFLSRPDINSEFCCIPTNTFNSLLKSWVWQVLRYCLWEWWDCVNNNKHTTTDARSTVTKQYNDVLRLMTHTLPVDLQTNTWRCVDGYLFHWLQWCQRLNFKFCLKRFVIAWRFNGAFLFKEDIFRRKIFVVGWRGRIQLNFTIEVTKMRNLSFI